jgi:hypothetical protein
LNPEGGLLTIHSEIGDDAVEAVEFPKPVADIVVQPHERLNGTGYHAGRRPPGQGIFAELISQVTSAKMPPWSW